MVPSIFEAIPTCRDAMTALSPHHPGRGPDFVVKDELDHAMAYALYGSAAAIKRDQEQAILAADWLVANHYDGPGWGLPFAWEAFGREVRNPVTTVYGITTALAVRALIDVYELSGGLSYGQCAKNALEYYLQFFNATEDGGYFWYSDQPQDNKSVHNVTAMLMGQYARASLHWPNTGFRAAAQQAANYLLTQRQESELGMYWSYWVGASRPNDSVHAAYVVQGFIDYARALGCQVDIDSALRYLSGFVRSDRVYEFNPHPGLNERTLELPARVWGVGMLVQTLSDGGLIEDAIRATRALPAYAFGPGRFAVRPGEREILPRAQAHVVLGLARLEQALGLKR